jgi:ribose transport system substrate-binding protein
MLVHNLFRTTAGCLGLAIALASATARAGSQAAVDDVGATILSLGPNGEKPEPASSIQLTAEEITSIKALHAKAAIALHYTGNDWSQAQVDGLKAQFDRLGIDVIATTDAGFKPDKQVSDIETVLAQKPNIIVSIPVDPVATASAYRAAEAAGVKLVFMDSAPRDFVAGKDYVSVVSADNYGLGVAAAHLLAQALGGQGDIGIIFRAEDFFVTKQRYEAVRKTLADNYPNIHIVAEQGIGGPDYSSAAEKAAGAILVSHPRIKGIWAVWDGPAEGVIAAATTNGRDDLVVTTCDLGENVAINIASGGVVKGLSAQRPYDQGATEALLAGYGLLGKKAPAYVALPALPVTKANLADAWEQVYHKPVTDKIKKSM